MVDIVDVAKFLGMPKIATNSPSFLESLLDNFKTKIVDPITGAFSSGIVTPLVNGYSTNINNPITSWISTNILGPITAIPTNVTQSWLTTLQNTIINNINGYFVPNQTTLLNLSIASKNLLMNLFINPIIHKIPNLNPIDDPYNIVFDSEGIHVNTSSLFYDGSYYIGLITYKIFRQFFMAVYETFQEAGNWFNNNISGTEIRIPFPLFSGKSIVLATKIGDVWVPNEALNIQEITDWDTLKTNYPYFDMFPYNVKLPDKVLMNNSSVIDTATGTPTTYKRSDLAYDIECFIIITVLISLLVKVGLGAHQHAILKKMAKHAALNPQYAAVYNEVTYKQSSNKSLLYLLALATRGSSANKNSVNISLGNISGLTGLLDDLEVVSDDDSVELEIKADTENLLKRYNGGYS